MRSLDVASAAGGAGHGPCSPKHRVSIVAAHAAHSLDTSLDAHVAAAYGSDGPDGGGAGSGPSTTTTATTTSMPHQQSLDASGGASSTTNTSTRIAIDAHDLPDIVAESLEALLATKPVREKRLELEKKLDSLRKKHDKDKLKVASALRAAAAASGDAAAVAAAQGAPSTAAAASSSSDRKTKFYMNNPLVKRLSSKHM